MAALGVDRDERLVRRGPYDAGPDIGALHAGHTAAAGSVGSTHVRHGHDNTARTAHSEQSPQCSRIHKVGSAFGRPLRHFHIRC
jgi:hypothetical protein